jgi:SAM-dependent methyltransferase
MRRRGRIAFLESLPSRPKILDVGCGNNSPEYFKASRPDCYYVGLDVGDYNQDSPTRFADRYIITTPVQFAAEIRTFAGEFDAVVSSHNIEHCQHPDVVLKAMLRALKPGGKIYLSFPCEESVSFPRREGTLNFYDDSTHQRVPDWTGILSGIRAEGLSIDFSAKRYRPYLMFLIGLAMEPISGLTRKVKRGTWDLYGFESVIWASRPPQAG